MPYKRRNINIDKLSSYVRRTGICTEEAALHLMDEIMFLRADNRAKQALIDNFKIDDLVAVFTKELEKQIVSTFEASRAKALSDAIEAVDAAGGDNEDYHIEAIKRKFGSEI